MQRYFLKEKHQDTLILYEQDIHHIKNVMRYKENDQIEVVWNGIVYLCKIDVLNPLKLSIIKEYQEDRDLNISLTIAVSLVQEQKFDLILQKLTELGVSRIIPVKTSRSIVKIDPKKVESKLNRWQTICKEASEQSHRTSIPKVTNIISLKELVSIPTQLKLICSLNDLTKPLNEYLNQDIKEIIFVVGPEGGFTKEEEAFLIENTYKPVSLGKRVLRVETAAIYISSIINYIYGG